MQKNHAQITLLRFKNAGIEAAKQSIVNQITETMKEHGVNVNPRHINLLS